MEVVVDGKNNPHAVPDTATFQELFDSLHRAAGGQRRIIVSMKLDGVVLSQEEQGRLRVQVLPPGGRLEIGTADRTGLAVNTLSELIPHLGTLERAHQAAAEQVIAANYRDAMVKFKECFDGWALLVNAIRSISSMATVDLGPLRSRGGPVTVEIKKIQETLTRFKTAFDQTDVVRLGDITQYDLKPLLEDFRGIFEALRRNLLESAPTPR
jgi:hypothetical protein